MQTAIPTSTNTDTALESSTPVEDDRVKVKAQDAGRAFVLTATQEKALLETLAHIERGGYVSFDKMLTALRPTAQGTHEAVVLAASQQEALLESLARIERGDYVSCEKLMTALRCAASPLP